MDNFLRKKAPRNSPFLGPSRSTRRVTPSLRLNTLWTLAGNIIYAACQWGILIAIARLSSPETLGRFALAMAVVAPIFMFTNLNLRYVQVTDIRDQFLPHDYVFLRFLTTALALTATVFAAWSLDALTIGLIIALMACTKASESLSDILHGIQHKKERMASINLARGIRGILSFAAIASILAATRSLTTAMVGLALVNLFVLLIIDLPTAKMPMRYALNSSANSLHMRFSTLCRLALISVPMGLGAALLTFNLHLPRYFIGYYLDSASLGYYAAAAYLIVATDIIVRSARTTALPRLARLFQDNQIKPFYQLTGRLMLLGFFTVFPCLILVWFAGDKLLAWTYGPEYASSGTVLFWLMVANLIWQSSVPTAALWAMRCYWTDLSVRVATTVTIGLAAFLLVPSYGLLGAAWSMIAGRLVGSVCTAISTIVLLKHSSKTARAIDMCQPHAGELAVLSKSLSFSRQRPATA